MTPLGYRFEIMLPHTTISTLVTPREWQQMALWLTAHYRTRSCHTLEELYAHVASGATDAILISVACCETSDTETLRSLLRQYPRLRTVALLMEIDARAPSVILALGRCGVQHIVDLRVAGCWKALRHILSSAQADHVHYAAMALLRETLPHSIQTTPAWTFFDALFAPPAATRTVRQLAASMEMGQSTFLSRFYRLRLPHVKQYLTMARLARAAHLLEDPRVPIAYAADTLGYASPQSFARHVRMALKITPTTFRQRYNGARMIQMFHDELVKPHVHKFLRLAPTARYGRSDRRVNPPGEGA